jgi:hypothetical protein
MTRPSVYCLPCKDSTGESVVATKLAPQTALRGCYQWVPVCDGHGDADWFDPSMPEETFPGPIVDIALVKAPQ